MKWKLPRATTAERTADTPEIGEILFDTDLEQAFIGDGVTVGGKLLRVIAVSTTAPSSPAVGDLWVDTN